MPALAGLTLPLRSAIRLSFACLGFAAVYLAALVVIAILDATELDNWVDSTTAVFLFAGIYGTAYTGLFAGIGWLIVGARRSFGSKGGAKIVSK